jgi:1-acyl-sn-glycerol-3-phosphate acyltransferase
MDKLRSFTLPKTPLVDSVPGRSRRFRVRTRSRVIGGAFNLVNLTTRFDIEGRDNLVEAIARAKASGRGLITVSNHLSLFDDPLVLIKVLRLRNFTVETKCWWSTACASNFNPQGSGLGARVTRWFNEVSNMVFMARSYKGCKAEEMPESLVELLAPKLGWRRAELLEERAKRLGTTAETYVRSFVTAQDGESPTSLDQTGLLEACARINVGDWLHFFPEGGRSRNLFLRPARPGVGKVIYHAPDAEVLPLCFYGTQDVLPVGAVVPRPFKRVAVSVGRPLPNTILEPLRHRAGTVETFSELSRFAMAGVAALRPAVLARYLGAQEAFELLAEEQAEEALAAQAEAPAPRLIPVDSYPWPAMLDDSDRPTDRRADV